MILSVHQPNFLPWIGYFHKIIQSDIFVMLDTVQVPRGKSVANRNKIKTSGGAFELVVPLSFPSGSERISSYREVLIADKSWKVKALKTLGQNYARAEYFDQIHPFITECFDQNGFFEMNHFFIHSILKEFGIEDRLVLLSALETNDERNNQLILNICKKLGADTYLSGKGAASYNDPEMYKTMGVALTYQEYEPITYKQLHGTFIPNLSMLDMLYNLGFQTSFELLNHSATAQP
jgi:hypothetical protein